MTAYILHWPARKPAELDEAIADIARELDMLTGEHGLGTAEIDHLVFLSGDERGPAVNVIGRTDGTFDCIYLPETAHAA